MQRKMKIVVAITGASGSIYAKRLLDQLTLLSNQIETVGLVLSDNARDVWRYELGELTIDGYPFNVHAKNDFFAPFASGSAKYDAMVICPCSMGTLARIAHGISSDLTGRAADVMLKERRKLILVVRETPYSLIHLKNMQAVTEAGAIICPASPSFYSRPESFEDLADTVINRVVDLLGLQQSTYRWGDDTDI
ncbi:UbiX family flavin prenyltransferase [Olivibacter sitiensis]|uniref:UbiX family flavin prenyltransferase n=1 Tax=Olivibacter sitiensis TaxID=376470 RepID=UPI000482C3B7|nr:flavin prenyltransferase UbiX [Olivibacter sitiensis]